MKKYVCSTMQLLEGLGVEGDAHAGKTVQHLSRLAKFFNKPNLRQVHLIHNELLDELRLKGFDIAPGQMGENITTKGIDLLGLPENTVLKIGEVAHIRITGLRNPCKQLDGIQPGLMQAVLDRDKDGNLIRKAGVMAVVEQSGMIHSQDTIEVILPSLPHKPLEPV